MNVTFMIFTCVFVNYCQLLSTAHFIIAEKKHPCGCFDDFMTFYAFMVYAFMIKDVLCIKNFDDFIFHHTAGCFDASFVPF